MNFINAFTVDKGTDQVVSNDQPNLWFIVPIEFIVLLIPVYLFMRR